ncbi:hypothetical protein MKW92_038724 [Papaver armeniacum]|nr:hypothetical protein MKW92_038724 [Papaver armeniacum]
MEEQPPPPPPPPPAYLSILGNCIISSSQEDLLDQKGFAFSDNIHQDGQIDEEFEQPSLPLDDHSTGIRICSLEDDSISSSSGDESLDQKNLGLSKGNHGDDSIGEEEDRGKLVKESVIWGAFVQVVVIRRMNVAKAKEFEDEEEDIMGFAIKSGLEMPRPRWWRSGGYEIP